MRKTNTQEKVLDYIIEYYRFHKLYPRQADIVKGFHITKQRVNQLIRVLAGKKLIKVERGKITKILKR